MEDVGIEGRIILKCILKKQDRTSWTGLFGSGQRRLEGRCEDGNRLWSTKNCWNFFLTSSKTISFSRRTLLNGFIYLFLFCYQAYYSSAF
jgi:hypothetical protein